jgi:hypothetical protein
LSDFSNQVYANLLTLFLANNTLNTFDLNTFTQLQQLDLSGNIQLLSINSNTLPNVFIFAPINSSTLNVFSNNDLSSLDTLSLNNNQINQFTNNNLNSATVLDLSNNQLSDISNNILSSLTSINLSIII